MSATPKPAYTFGRVICDVFAFEEDVRPIESALLVERGELVPLLFFVHTLPSLDNVAIFAC